MSFYYRPSLIVFKSNDFNSGANLILSDHGREPMQIDTERIENRVRMASGRMRSKFIADKYTFNLSWNMLPSRSFVNGSRVVADGYASASDLMAFYQDVTGEFQMTLYADNGGGTSLSPGQVFGVYNVFFDSFDMEIEKRGSKFDFYNVSLGLEQA